MIAGFWTWRVARHNIGAQRVLEADKALRELRMQRIGGLRDIANGRLSLYSELELAAAEGDAARANELVLQVVGTNPYLDPRWMVAGSRDSWVGQCIDRFLQAEQGCRDV